MTESTLALSLPLPGIDTRDGIELARRAVDWGYRACWLAEVQGPDAFTQLGALAVTTDLELGVAVVPVQTRSPMVLGMSAVTLAELSSGRFTLGIGASSEVIVTRWAGQPFDAPLQQVRETVEALRPILRGERATVDGRFVRIDGYRPHVRPTAPVPLWIGALNPRSLRQTGEIADGVCLNQLAPEHVESRLAHVRTGAERAGREIEIGVGPGQFGVMARVFCAVVDDVSAARALVKSIFGPYLATSVYNRYYRDLGYLEEADAVAKAAVRGDRDAMAAGMSDRLVDEIFVLGGRDEVAERVRAYADAGVGVVAVQPLARDLAAAEETLRAAALGW